VEDSGATATAGMSVLLTFANYHATHIAHHTDLALAQERWLSAVEPSLREIQHRRFPLDKAERPG
jgi:hypothetical protein